MLKHFEPGSSGASLGLSRSRNCCDCCTLHLLRGGAEGASADAATGEDNEVDMSSEVKKVLQVSHIILSQLIQ